MKNEIFRILETLLAKMNLVTKDIEKIKVLKI